MTASGATPVLPLVGHPDDPLVHDIFDKLGSGILNLHRTMAHAPRSPREPVTR